jgi:hypothetical protein
MDAEELARGVDLVAVNHTKIIPSVHANCQQVNAASETFRLERPLMPRSGSWHWSTSGLVPDPGAASKA